ncbi:MAG: hypothetical protein Q9227_001966 [Pyrenula ochraceoflavens]
MLKSTHKPSSRDELPPGWTAHKAPSGHAYYYNSITKQSTYNRPRDQPEQQSSDVQSYSTGRFFAPTSNSPGTQQDSLNSAQQPYENGLESIAYHRLARDRTRREREDRPKSKRAILNSEPWILVTTRLCRRFVYNSKTNESFWKFPEDVMLAVIEMERQDREQEHRQKQDVGRQGPGISSPTPHQSEPSPAPRPLVKPVADHSPESEEDSYEEVEVTDDEEGSPKRQKTGEITPQGPVEFDEDDIAYQLAAMGEDYGLDPEEFGASEELDVDNEAVGLRLTEIDAKALFCDMLDDHAVNPYSTWDAIIDQGNVIGDNRYTVLPSMRARKDAFSCWSGNRIRELKEKRAQEEQKDPRIGFVRFIRDFATPKLYWPEFRRKFKKAPEMKDAKMSDKEREKLYRQHISRLKLPETVRKSDLKSLLKSISLTELNRGSSIEILPSAILTDLRFISLPPQLTTSMIEEHILSLEDVQKPDAEGFAVDALAEGNNKKLERERRQQALAERQKLVDEEKRKQQDNLRHGKGLMRENEMELKEASKVKNDGMLGYLRDGS